MLDRDGEMLEGSYRGRSKHTFSGVFATRCILFALKWQISIVSEYLTFIGDVFWWKYARRERETYFFGFGPGFFDAKTARCWRCTIPLFWFRGFCEQQINCITCLSLGASQDSIRKAGPKNSSIFREVRAYGKNFSIASPLWISSPPLDQKDFQC